MREPDFYRATREATKLLWEQEVYDRVLDVRNLNFNKTIVFDSIQNYCMLTRTPISVFLSSNRQALRDGCTIYDRETDTYIILLNEEVFHFEHYNWTCGHEVGHVYLGHKNDGPIEEIEAHYFAAQLFMPEYTIFEMGRNFGPITANDLIEIFGVSRIAAEKRLTTMSRKFSVNASYMDVEIWKMQEPRIRLYFDCKKNGQDFRYELENTLEENRIMTRLCYGY